MSVPIIELDSTSWKTVHQFYEAILSAIGAPEKHGRNANALVDSMIWGGMNDLAAPYRIRISGAHPLPREVREHIQLVEQSLSEARAEHRAAHGEDIVVQVQMVP
jgi:hypothetical protein